MSRRRFAGVTFTLGIGAHLVAGKTGFDQA
jgi:hypothetical protein